MSDTQKYPLLAVVGPTASGKSELALELAGALGGEIVSCDSMQVYRGMDIGTAKPTQAERRGIPHHLIDIAEPDAPFTCSDYVRACRPVIADICARGRLPVLCGGTGLYLERLLYGGAEEPETAPDPALRRRWLDYAAAHGAHALHRRLAEVDPAGAGVNQKRAGVARHQKCPHLFHFNRPCAGSKRFDVIAVVHKIRHSFPLCPCNSASLWCRPCGLMM